MAKTNRRQKRAIKTRARIKRLMKNRLSVHRTSKHIYAQIISPDGKVLAMASSLEAAISKSVDYTGNTKSAAAVGKLVSERAKAQGIDNIAFDRGHFQYHGRVKALADAAREHITF